MVFGMMHVSGEVPGTVRLTKSHSFPDEDQDVKMATGRNSHIILSPQPSDDPDDPLNWPQWRKNMILVSISLVASLTNAIGPMLSTAFLAIAREYSVSLDTVTLATGGMFSIAVGIATFFTTALAVKYGKRPMFILSTVTLIGFSIWAEFAGSIVQLAIARCLQGIAAAPFETLVSATVADLYFVHERGQKLALWGLSIGAGLMISQVGGGAVVQYLGWRILFLITTISFVVMSALVIFGVPETAYVRVSAAKCPITQVMIERDRKRRANDPLFALEGSQFEAMNRRMYGASINPVESLELERLPPVPMNESRASIAASSIYSSVPLAANLTRLGPEQNSQVYAAYTSETIRLHSTTFVSSKLAQIADSPARTMIETTRKTHWQSLSFTIGKQYSSKSFWKLAVRPIPLLIYPAVLFTSVINGLNYTFLLAFGLASITLFASEPYNLKPVGIGLTSLPAVVAASIGQPIAGYVTDRVSRFLTHRNKGLYEPEMRLTSMLPSTFFATLGFIGFGLSIRAQQESGHANIAVPLAWYAVIAFSVPWTNVAAFTYLIDSHADVTNEAFVTTHVTKGIMIFGVAATLNGWLARSGVAHVFLTIAAVNFGVSCMTLVFWVYGKRMRAWIAASPRLRSL